MTQIVLVHSIGQQVKGPVCFWRTSTLRSATAWP
jgi:hypothetical protein